MCVYPYRAFLIMKYLSLQSEIRVCKYIGSVRVCIYIIFVYMLHQIYVHVFVIQPKRACCGEGGFLYTYVLYALIVSYVLIQHFHDAYQTYVLSRISVLGYQSWRKKGCHSLLAIFIKCITSITFIIVTIFMYGVPVMAKMGFPCMHVSFH